MTTIPGEPPILDQASLQTEAANVERLRRNIAELSSKWEVVTPQLLAQFASAQKKYLDRKIRFEKQRREGGVREVVPPLPPTVEPAHQSAMPVETPAPIETAAAPVNLQPSVSPKPIPQAAQVAQAAPRVSKKPLGWLIAAGVVIVGAIVWWFMRK